ncbi:MAG: acyl-CoA thioesterase [Simkaniaceae bacterium]|nr:acyl-CoA thioesterase [Simkaniaceae bacterium]
MFKYLKTVKLEDTDATGVIYFAKQMTFSLEAFETWLSERKYPLSKIIESGEYLYPIVHASADYKAPVKVGDELVIHLHVAKIGNSSFTITSEHHKNSVLVGYTEIVHVCQFKESGRSCEINPQMRKLLESEMELAAL